ncbi:preprotein translocase subunit SecE [Mesomycoplasma molare]|uniref:Protein translocase subunit SecE n=1 Tax=Mesomycoplasma molare TaxID=171288 RepID=A0ABY5TTT3_9BACT|nr:preprotein translocase subunit SecE [Mesomycoplasma molare]UWD34068.1 preprotein translocase subunit SecE [Mesomycoplasma molare]
MKEKKLKKNKLKKYYFRNWMKEIKRIKWPSQKDATNNFYLILLFVTICSIIFLLISFVATWIWNLIGVGI